MLKTILRRGALAVSLFVAALFSSALLQSCKEDLSGIEADIKDLQERVDALETAVEALRAAYEDGKIISSVAPHPTKDGWLVTFSDNSSISLTNGRDGATGETGATGAAGSDGRDGIDAVTPLLMIDTSGYWMVSYDNGASYEHLLDPSGAKIKALGLDGAPGQDGVDGKPGADGKPGEDGKPGADGADGLCVRVVVDDRGLYCFEIYDPADPSVVKERVETPYDSDPAAVVRAVKKDPVSGVVTIIMADGSEFSFNLDVRYPTGIVLLADAVAIGEGGTATFEFRVNPSNAFIDFDPSQGMIRLDLVNEELLSRVVADSYVTDPVNFRLEKIEASLTPSGDVKAGQYRATIRDLAVEKDYAQGVALVLNSTDGAGNPVQISSAMMRVEWGAGSSIQSFSVNGSPEAERVAGGSLLMVRLPYGTDPAKCVPTFTTSAAGIYCDGVQLVSGSSELDLSMPRDLTICSRSGVKSTVRVAAAYSDLPILYLSTPSAIESKEVWVEGSRLELLNTSGHLQDMDVPLSVKGRGNSTWNYPKKPYALKLDKKDSVLGMPRHKRWVLLANYIDPSKIRNAFAFEIARQTESLPWTPRGEFVDLVVNGQMMGNYYLCEQIRVDRDRVDIVEMEAADNSGDPLTGGYLLELDKIMDEVNTFYTARRRLPVMVKSPDDDVMTSEQLGYISSYFDQLENTIYTSTFPGNGEYREFVDLETFADWWLVHEICTNAEPTHPKSCYMYKDRGGKLCAGPVWDFDWGTFTTSRENTFVASNSLWYFRFLRDPVFKEIVQRKWEALLPKIEVLPEQFLLPLYARLSPSVNADYLLWPRYFDPSVEADVNEDITLTPDQSLERIVASYRRHLRWLDTAIRAL